LFHGGETTGLSRIGAPNPHTPSRGAVDVEVVTLDHYCAGRGLVPQWGVVDAEGYELEVLTGASGLLANRRVSFVVEMHPDLWALGRQTTAARLEALLRSCGRKLIPLTGQGNSLQEYGTIAIG